jgi:hypothetical protein
MSPSDFMCHRCGRTLTPGTGSFYIVRVEAFADPTPPAVDDDEASAATIAEYEMLLARMAGMSERELMDQVYRRLTLTLCTPCYQEWIERPTG